MGVMGAAALGCALLLLHQTALAAPPQCASVPPGKAELYSYNVTAEYVKDPTSFTQGLVFDRRCNETTRACKDVLYESTGIYGDSDVRLVDLGSGAVERRTKMDARWFGEGLVKRGDLLYQITWQGPTGFIYSAEDLSPAGTFKTPLRDGWGATVDGRLLVLSDGSSSLTWVDPDGGFARVRTVEVKYGGRPVPNLNELEMVDGEVWANIWQTQCIARICPATGQVTGWLLMHGLRDALLRRNLPMRGKEMDVLNGIAWDAARRRLFVTGKYWPRLFVITPKPVNATARVQQMVSSCFQTPFG